MHPVAITKQALRLLTILAAFFGGLSTASAQDDEAGVRAAIEQYFQGHATADAATNFKGVPAQNEASRRRTTDIIDVMGTAAMARATLVHGQTTFTDYFVLLKVDGAWKIANKVYTAAPTAPR